MGQLELFIDKRSLFEKLCSLEYLENGFDAVRKNKGAPGVDGVTVKEFGSRLDEELGTLKQELEGWTYLPGPVLRVEILKTGQGSWSTPVRDTQRS